MHVCVKLYTEDECTLWNGSWQELGEKENGKLLYKGYKISLLQDENISGGGW